jgi:hypothetical protein
MISLARASSVVVLLATFTALSGCNSDRDGNRVRGAQPGATATAALRLLHASPDAPNVDVSVDGAVALANVPYEAGAGYLDLPAGPRRLQVSPAGTTTAVIDVTPDLGAGRKYTALAINRVAALEPLLLEDDATPIAATDVRLRVVHAAPGVGLVDVYVTAPGADLSTATPTLDDVAFKTASGQLTIPAGTYQVRLTLGAGGAAVYDSGPVALPGGADLCISALETSQGASPVTLVALTGDPAAPTLELTDRRAFVRVVHASPDAPNVDVLVDGAVALSGVPFRAASGYLEVDGGGRRVQVNPANTTTSVIDATLPLDATRAYTVLAVDRVSMIGALVLQDDRSAPAAGNVKVRLVHAAPSAGLVDIYVTAPDASLASAAPTLAGVDFKDASGYLEVPAGSYRVRITLAGTKTVAIDTGALALAAGTVATGVAVDPLPNTSAFGALLLTDR